MSQHQSTPRGRPRFLHAAAAGLALVPTLALAAYPDDVDFTELQAELGGTTPTGAGVIVAQVEAATQVNGQNAWMPDGTNTEFAGKTIGNMSGAPAGLYSSHATSVGKLFYGTTSSLAPAITNVSAWWADNWLASGALNATNGIQPVHSTSRLTNHSWVGDFSTLNTEVLRRLDWLIETDDSLQVAAMNNGSGTASVNAMLASAFNVIAVGRSDGLNQIGSVAVDTLYVAGRTRPDVVIPAGSTSSAAPRVAAIVALLVQTGHGNAALSTDPSQTSYTNGAGSLIRNAERVEVIKAALMAGADRVTRNSSSTNLALYRGGAANQSGNGLDLRYGAGQVNVLNSYRIIAAGEQNSAEDGGSGSGILDRGFDWDRYFGGSSGSNTTGTYALPVAAVPRLLTASLVWTVDVNGGTPGAFNSAATLRDLALSVIDVASPSSPVTVVTSQSTTENTENVYLVVPANAQYALRVSVGSGSAFRYDYGIAWQLATDTDSDGAHDGQDNCIDVANGPLIPDGGGNSQRDTDGDGYGNVCDGDLNNSGGIVNYPDLSLFRAAFGTSNAEADIDGSGGIVNYTDLALFRGRFGKAPGPSAFAPP
jgi:hypothetical protein